MSRDEGKVRFMLKCAVFYNEIQSLINIFFNLQILLLRLDNNILKYTC